MSSSKVSDFALDDIFEAVNPGLHLAAAVICPALFVSAWGVSNSKDADVVSCCYISLLVALQATLISAGQRGTDRAAAGLYIRSVISFLRNLHLETLFRQS